MYCDVVLRTCSHDDNALYVIPHTIKLSYSTMYIYMYTCVVIIHQRVVVWVGYQ